MKDIIKYDISDNTELFGYRCVEWIWRESAASLFLRIFKTIPSMRRHNYLTERGAMEELARAYSYDERYDLFESTYLPRLYNEQQDDDDEDEEDNEEVYNCVMICGEYLMVGYFEKTVDIYYAGSKAKAEVKRIMDICEDYSQKRDKVGFK